MAAGSGLVCAHVFFHKCMLRQTRSGEWTHGILTNQVAVRGIAISEEKKNAQSLRF